MPASVRDVVFVPGKHQLISIGDDSVGLIWNTSTGERIAKLVGHEQPLTTVAASADGRFVATGGNNEAKVVIWDAATYDLRQSLDFGPAESLAFSPDSTCLAIAGRDGHVRLCQRDDQDSWSLTKTIPTAANVIHDIEWSPDGTRLAAAGEDGAVKLWDTKTWNEVGNLRLFRESVYDIEFSPNGRRLAAAIRNEAITIWDVDDPQHSTALTGHTSLVTGVRFCADGWRLLSASEDGSVRLWDAARPTDHDCLEGHRGPVRTIAYSPDGSTFASGGADGAIIVWNAETGHPRRIIRSLAGHLEDLAFSPDGSRLAAVEWNGHLRLWPIEPNKRLLDLNLGIGPLRAVAWSPDGRNVAVQALDGSIRLIDGMAGKLLGGWTSSRQPHGSITFDGTGEMLLTCDGDWIVRVWNAAAHTLRHELKGHTGSVVRAVYNPQGTLIASSSNDHTIRLWDAKSGRHLRSFTGHAGTPLGLAFNSDGTRLASSSTDHTVKLWDVATGMELQSLSGHTSWARDVAFSPNGRQLASAGSDGSIRIWHTRLTSDDNTLLEAIALVNDLSSAVSDRAALVATISRDLTVREAVRAAAIEQCKGRLLHWPDMIAAHRAAERHDWSAAIESFGRVTHLAPDDVMHWHWLAMANVAANRRESYQQCCEEMLRRFARNGDSHELYWTAGACLALPQQVDKLKPVRKLLDKLPSSIQPPLYSWLYDVRTDAGPLQLHEIVEQSKAVDFDEASWYGLAMVWYQAGDLNQSQAAYRNALNASRSGIQHWNWHAKVFRDALRREVAKLLASAPSTEKEPVADATPGTSRPSDTLSAGEPPSAAPSAAQQ